MPNPPAMTASGVGVLLERVLRTTGRRDSETLVPPVQFLSVLCCSRLACTDSATDGCLAQAKESRLKEAAFRTVVWRRVRAVQ